MVGELRVKVLVNSLLSYLHHTEYHLAAGALQQQLLPAAGHRGGGEGPGHLLRHTRGGERQSLHKQVWSDLYMMTQVNLLPDYTQQDTKPVLASSNPCYSETLSFQVSVWSVYS